jgi:hypothetical protein
MSAIVKVLYAPSWALFMSPSRIAFSPEATAMPHTPRRLRLAENVSYHLMNRGLDREAVFRDGANRRAFLPRVADDRSRVRLRLDHSCRMDHDINLVIRPRAPHARLPPTAGPARPRPVWPMV